jgi:hypothetical protein
VSRANDVDTEVQCNVVLNRSDKKERSTMLWPTILGRITGHGSCTRGEECQAKWSRLCSSVYLSGSAVGNNNQYVDTGLSYITRRRQGNKEVAGSWLGRFPASLGGCHMTAAFPQLITRWPATDPGRRPGDRVVLSVLVLNRDNT